MQTGAAFDFVWRTLTIINRPTHPHTQYHNGSWLREHVDTGDTHIISAIMNIDQDVREDWHLSFIDHNGDRHYIALQVRPAPATQPTRSID